MSKKRKTSAGVKRLGGRPQAPSRPSQKASIPKASKSSVNASTKESREQHQAPLNIQDEAIIPFGPRNRILLVGEADLSFAASLVQHRDCLHVTATVLEADAAELEAKYPNTAAANAAVVSAASPNCRVIYGVDVTTRGPFRIPGRSKSRKKRKKGPLSADEFNIAANTDADVVGKDSNRDMVDDDIWDRIVFNFPHVGGKSKDVIRQVRYNQELLVAFFERAKQSLAPCGAIIVTVFEGEPYSLWNVRDLGRHSGLRVERSFRFQPSAYPGYHHSRTLGLVKSKKTGDVAATAWKGEERPSRCFVFVRKDDVDVQIEGVSFVSKKTKKRQYDSEDDIEYEDLDEYDHGEEGDDWEEGIGEQRDAEPVESTPAKGDESDME